MELKTVTDIRKDYTFITLTSPDGEYVATICKGLSVPGGAILSDLTNLILKRPDKVVPKSIREYANFLSEVANQFEAYIEIGLK